MVSDNLNHDNDSSDPINTDTSDTSLTLGDPSDADGDTDGEIWCQDSHTLSLLLQDDQTA